MSSRLFAFQVARPVEDSSEEVLSAEYDAQTQVTIWNGGSRPQAVHCTNMGGQGAWYCNAYGDYCHTSGPVCTGHSPSYFCDN